MSLGGKRFKIVMTEQARDDERRRRKLMELFRKLDVVPYDFVRELWGLHITVQGVKIPMPSCYSKVKNIEASDD